MPLTDVAVRSAKPQEKPYKLLEIAAAEGRCEDESWRVRRDGTRVWANEVITALRDSSGTLTGYAKISRDLTERKQAEDVVLGSRDELNQRVQYQMAELVRVKEELHRRENRIRSIVGDRVHVEMTTYDLDKGRIVFREKTVNPPMNQRRFFRR